MQNAMGRIDTEIASRLRQARCKLPAPWHAPCNLPLMKAIFHLPLLAVITISSLCSCASDNDDRPIPGTVEATSTKDNANINNTPRTNPTPNPDPESQPPDSVQAR